MDLATRPYCLLILWAFWPWPMLMFLGVKNTTNIFWDQYFLWKVCMSVWEFLRISSRRFNFFILNICYLLIWETSLLKFLSLNTNQLTYLYILFIYSIFICLWHMIVLLYSFFIFLNGSLGCSTFCIKLNLRQLHLCHNHNLSLQLTWVYFLEGFWV